MPYNYYVRGWSGRLGLWIDEPMECRSKQEAREMFKSSNPTLKKVHVLILREKHDGIRNDTKSAEGYSQV